MRTIQQNDLDKKFPGKKILGVIRPTTEIIGDCSKNKSCWNNGDKRLSVQSQSYLIEIEKFSPDTKVVQQACSMLVPLIENNEFENEATDYFIQKYINELLKQDDKIDTILLACTHYPLIKKRIEKFLPKDITVIAQGEIVASKAMED